MNDFAGNNQITLQIELVKLNYHIKHCKIIKL